MKELLLYLYNIINFTFKDVMVGIATVTLLTLLLMAILYTLGYIICKLIKGKTRK